MTQISERILALYKEKHISYGEFSKLTGIPKSALQRYATGKTEKIPLDRIEAIARGLHTTPEYLLGWTDVAVSIRNAESIAEVSDPVSNRYDKKLKIWLESIITEDSAIMSYIERIYLNPDFLTITKGAHNMTLSQIEQLRKYAEFMFPEAFSDIKKGIYE